MDAHPPLPSAIWEHTPPIAQEMIMAQEAMLAQLRAEVVQLKVTVEALAQRLGRHSRNSSQPPAAAACEAALDGESLRSLLPTPHAPQPAIRAAE
jgi:hypothetical protein